MYNNPKSVSKDKLFKLYHILNKTIKENKGCKNKPRGDKRKGNVYMGSIFSDLLFFRQKISWNLYMEENWKNAIQK